MKITLFTSNQIRHNFLINYLGNFASKLNVIQECKTVFPGKVKGSYSKNLLIEKYFKNVQKAEEKIFGKTFINIKKKNTNILSIAYGDLNYLKLKEINNFLQSDLYIVFGSSFIKGSLINFLIKKKTINLHMGVSPYYRGADCNFWAVYDNNPHLVGATIHKLSKGVDSGNILYHSMPKITTNSFEYTMLSVKSAFYSIATKIKDRSILKIKPVKQNRKLEIRYSKKREFNQKIVKKFLDRKKSKITFYEFDNSLLINPYFLK